MPSNPQDKIQAAVDTVKELLHGWIDRTMAIPAVKKRFESIQGNVVIVTHEKRRAKEKGTELPAYVKELEDRGEGALLKDLSAWLAKYDADTERLTDAVRTIREYAHQAGIKSKPLFQVFDRQQFDRYEDALLVLGDVEVALGAGSGEQPAKRKNGRPKKTEKDSDTKVISALSAHHGYENGSVTNSAPATNRGLSDKYKLSANALTRFLKAKGGFKKYQVMCRDGQLGTYLALWNRELSSRLPGLTEDESGRPDDE